jgi:NAD(P)-dependent dehydrogenase (short-subunit alcohol dehydrogenase family)
MTKLLKGKAAIIYGGGGGIGGGVARTFAGEGAKVFLVGRTREKLDEVAKDITSAGGLAEIAVVDALDEQAVNEHVRAVASEAGSVDVSFNLITRGDVQGTPLVEMATDDLLRAVVTGLQSNFITARAAARRMIEQGSGVILHLNSASGAGASPVWAAPDRPMRRRRRSCATWRRRSDRRACGCAGSGRPASTRPCRTRRSRRSAETALQPHRRRKR